jgi:hypothetical protein
MYTTLKKRFLREARPLPILIGLISGVAFNACAGLTVTAWLVDKGHSEGLVRKDGSGHVVQSLPWANADDFRCYSPSDDEAWRDKLRTCEAGGR